MLLGLTRGTQSYRAWLRQIRARDQPCLAGKTGHPEIAKLKSIMHRSLLYIDLDTPRQDLVNHMHSSFGNMNQIWKINYCLHQFSDNAI